MKFGPVMTYRDIAEAKRLIGKKVIHSDNFKEIGTKEDILASLWGRPTILTGVNDGPSVLYPFSLEGNSRSQFIREVIEEESGHHYEPYDLSDPKVRDSLRGEWFRDIQEDGEAPERMVTSFGSNEDGDEWCVNEIYTASTFLRDCVWIDDGTPCGREIEEVR